MMQALRHRWVFGMVVCAACGVTPEINEETCTDGIDNDGDGAMDCAEASCQEIVCCDFANPLEGSDPAEGATIGIREPLFVDMANDGPTAFTLSVGGEAVALDRESLGSVWRLTPDEPLVPDRSYVLDISSGCETTTVMFATSAVGSEDTPVASGRFALPLAQARWLEPWSVDEIVGAYATTTLHLEVDGDTAVLTGADANQEPDACQRGVPLQRIESDGAHAVYSGDGELWIRGPHGWGARVLVPAVYATWHEGQLYTSLTGYLDARTVPELGSGDDWCSVDLGYDCLPCPDGSGEACVLLHADRLPAVVPEAEPLPPLGQCESTDCSIHPACD